MPSSMRRPTRRSLPFSLIVHSAPVFLLALFIFLFIVFLTCSGFSFLCFSYGRAVLKDPIPKSFSLLAVNNKDPVQKPPSFLQRSHLSSNSINEPPSINQSYNLSSSDSEPVNGYPSPSSPNQSRKSKPLIKPLQPHAPQRPFSTRAAEFFNGYPPNIRNSSCRPRFFMTWINSVDTLGPRELLVVESVFKSHPNACLLIVSDIMDSAKGDIFLNPFTEKGLRLAAMSPDYGYLLKGTPADRWMKRLRSGAVDPGKIPLEQNLSNLLRLALLYKYGGIYIDTDVIVIKSFKGLKNVVGAQAVDASTGNWVRLNNAVLVFDKRHPLLYMFIEEFVLTFDGNLWGHNGPYLVSRVVSRVKKKTSFEFNVLPPPAFYPVDWNRIGGMLEGPRGGRHSRWVTLKHRWIMEKSFGLHLWNRQTRRIKAEQGSIIGRIMMGCCLFCNSTAFAMEAASA